MIDAMMRRPPQPLEGLNLQFTGRREIRSNTKLAGQHRMPWWTCPMLDPLSLRPIPALELRGSLADFARQIRDIPDGQTISVKPINLR